MRIRAPACNTPYAQPRRSRSGLPSDYDELERWTRVGYQRGMRFRRGSGECQDGWIADEALSLLVFFPAAELGVVICHACEWFSGIREAVRMEHGRHARPETEPGRPLVKAIVYDVVGAPALVRDVAEPDCPDDGAVITVRATGVCRSDWHAWRGHEAVPLPHIPGHEFAGAVAAVGAQVRRFAPGDRVTAPFVNGCGRCDWCRAGDSQICPDQTQPGFSHPGSFAERVVVQAADVNLVRLPDELDFVSAAVLGCRFATAFRALTAYRRVEPEDWVVVFGCGGVGLSAIMIARALGARVIGVDLSPAARARAAQLGAVAIDVAETSTAIAELTGAGAHLTVDALGSAATALAAVSGLRRGGQHVQVGLMLDADALAPLPWDLVVARELRVVGSHGLSAADYPAMLAMIIDGQLDLRELIAERIPLDEVGAAMMAMDNPVARRAGITVAVPDTGG
jgi:alcohol dehydrogenase